MCISFSKLKKKIIWVYTRFRIFFYITKKTKVLRGNLNIDLVFILESFPLEIDSICADTKNKIFKRWGHVGSQAILEIISKMFLLAQNVHQNLVICHCWCSRLLVRVSWLKRGSPERQFPGGEMLIRALSFLTFFFFFSIGKLWHVSKASFLCFSSVSMNPEMYFLFCTSIDFLDLWSRDFFANVPFIYKTSICYFFLFVRFWARNLKLSKIQSSFYQTQFYYFYQIVEKRGNKMEEKEVREVFIEKCPFTFVW